jgi:acetyltransferase-like isoleucine patch superfamily enzyme
MEGRASLLYRIHGIKGVTNLISFIPPQFIPDLLRKYGATVGEDFRIRGNLIVEAPTDRGQIDLNNLSIGNHCFIGKRVLLDISDRLVLGNYVVISPGVILLTHQSIGDRRFLSCLYPDIYRQTTIHDNVYIGAGAIIMPGITINQLSVIAAASLVLKDVPEGTLCAGIPAKVIKHLVIPKSSEIYNSSSTPKTSASSG